MNGSAVKTAMAMLIAFQFAGVVSAARSAKNTKPNVVIFYADDFGWGDIRRHNKNPDHFRYTPNLDRLFRFGLTDKTLELSYHGCI